MTLTIPQNTDVTARKMHELYRFLHAHPELSMQESATADFIATRLDALGLETFRCGGTGVVGVLRNGAGPTIGFRADTDGLPIAEETGLAYASVARGTLADGTDVPAMHGCGHDTHMAVALTAAEHLVDNRADWAGTLVFIFQPGEETGAGARAMVEDGLWDRAPHPEIIYGQHVWPGLAGTIDISSGVAMAMADSWKVTVHGRQAHGSQPDQSIDPIVLGAHMVVRLQTVVAREVHPMKSAVVTVGTFHGGLKENIIPATAEFTINMRTFDLGVRTRVLDSVRRIIAAEAQASAAPEPTIEVLSTFPRCYNDPAATEKLIAALSHSLGEDAIFEVPPVMGSEDFGLLAEAIGVPSVYWMFGGYSQQSIDSVDSVAGNHSPHFAPDPEPALAAGLTAALTAILSKVGTTGGAA
ncbi:amidohydrolase [Cryobacterium roopkundense]|uniref:Amidohydrolase n=1 Tax=Cryobacterium roopkundense TaxID=1001240 RepID=A0A099JGU8_9MICO|nr:amidohydrolase [Cryobacterium roopkundense]KGJ77461.1 amidohydrolase [Cryobacterium roopkundense]MBB5643326.1 hippurate hydrolase [Cryobacterium roopkundense]